MGTGRSQGTSKEKWVWALDAFEEGASSPIEVAKLLAKLTRERASEFEPVYILDLPALRLNPDPRMSVGPLSQFIPAAEKALDRRLSGVRGIDLAPPRVLVQKGISLVDSVRRLNRYCSTIGARTIVVGTHGRKGLERAVLGSFAETLVQNAAVPVLVVPAGKTRETISEVLFPTDLSRESEALLSEAIRVSRNLGAKLVVFHHIAHPVEALAQTGVFLLGGGWVTVPEFASSREAVRRKRAEAWLERVRKEGVEAELELQSSPKSDASAILEEIRRRSTGLVLMGTRSGPLRSVFIGSVARQVIRECPCPVWVVRAKKSASGAARRRASS